MPCRAPLREAIAAGGPATLLLDLRPDIDAAALAARLDGPRGGMSLANHLRRAGLPPVAIGLVQEALHAGAAAPLSRLVKALPLILTAPMGLDRAISSAGGLGWEEVDYTPDAAPPPRRLRLRRDAGLGGADRRLPAAGLLQHRRRGRAGGAGLAAQVRRIVRG